MSKSKILELQNQSQQNWIDIYESKQTNKVLSGTINAVEAHSDKLCSVVFYGDAKVLIPQDVFNFDKEPVTDEEVQARRRKMYASIGSKVDFVVLDIERGEGIAIASRKKAMEIRRKELPKLQEGQRVKCRVIAVGKQIAITEVLGVEKRLLPRDISWGLVEDLRDVLSAGDELDCVVKNIKLDNPDNPDISVSIRDTMPNPYLLVDKKYKQDSEYLGTVSLIREGGVFVNLEPGIDALCPHPGWTNMRLNTGDKVIVKIRKLDGENRKVRALIERLVRRASF